MTNAEEAKLSDLIIVFHIFFFLVFLIKSYTNVMWHFLLVSSVPRENNGSTCLPKTLMKNITGKGFGNRIKEKRQIRSLESTELERHLFSSVLESVCRRQPLVFLAQKNAPSPAPFSPSSIPNPRGSCHSNRLRIPLV